MQRPAGHRSTGGVSNHQLIEWMISLLAHGGPRSAIVATFGVDPRTVDDLWTSCGQYGQRVHEATVPQDRLDLQHVQMDKMRQIQGAILWMAITPARLWLSATVGLQRNKSLFTGWSKR
ncbi:MAG: hypothetical protein N2508_07585 [Anaerolineae bacterium]|nr:hypothetical protein [Anaerolineae bacterium]